MPRPKTNPIWKATVFRFLADNGPVAAATIHQQLQTIAPRLNKRVPSTRVIARYVQEWRDSEPEKNGASTYFSWPESMEAHLLPWEAADSALTLMRLMRRRPRLSTALWFWRVTLAIPAAPPELRMKLAGQLAVYSEIGFRDEFLFRTLEWYLAFRPWESEAAADAYETAIEDSHEERFGWDHNWLPVGQQFKDKKPPEEIHRFPESTMIPLSDDMESFFAAWEAAGELLSEDEQQSITEDLQSKVRKREQS